MKFNENLVRYRKLKGFTQEEMAEKFSYHVNVSDYWDKKHSMNRCLKMA